MRQVSSIVSTVSAVMVLAAMHDNTSFQHRRSIRRWPFPSPSTLIATPTAEVVLASELTGSEAHDFSLLGE